MQLVKEEKLQVVAGCAPPAGVKDVLLSVRCPVKVKSAEQSKDGEVPNKWVVLVCSICQHISVQSETLFLRLYDPAREASFAQTKGAGTYLDGDSEYRDTGKHLLFKMDFHVGIVAVQNPAN